MGDNKKNQGQQGSNKGNEQQGGSPRQDSGTDQAGGRVGQPSRETADDRGRKGRMDDSGEQGISNRPEESPNEADTGSGGVQSDNADRRPAGNQPNRTN